LVAVPPAGPLPCASGSTRPRAMTPRPRELARWRHLRPFRRRAWAGAGPPLGGGCLCVLRPPFGLARHPQAQPGPRSWARRSHHRNRGRVVTSSPVPVLRRAVEGSGGASKHDRPAQPETRTEASKVLTRSTPPTSTGHDCLSVNTVPTSIAMRATKLTAQAQPTNLPGYYSSVHAKSAAAAAASGERPPSELGY